MNNTEQAVISLDSARTRLAGIWVGGSLLIVGIVVLQTFLGNFADNTAQQVWEWLLPTVIPTTGMIVSTLAATALLQTSSDAVVRKSFCRLAELLSIFYLVLILGSICFKQNIAADTQTWLIKLHTSNLWLGPLQGIVASALGVLFVSKKDKPALTGVSEPQP